MPTTVICCIHCFRILSGFQLSRYPSCAATERSGGVSLEKNFSIVLPSFGLLLRSVNLQLDSSRKPAMQICIRVGCSCLQTGICCIPGPLDMQSQWLNLCTYPTTITRSKRQQNLVNARCPKQAQGMGWQQHMQASVCRCLCHGCHMTHTHPRQKN